LSHEQRELFAGHLRHGVTVSALVHQPAVDEVVQRPVLLEELLVVGEVYAREDAFEEALPFVFTFCLLKRDAFFSCCLRRRAL